MVQKWTEQLEKEDILHKDPESLLLPIREEICKMAQQNGKMPLVLQLDKDTELAMDPNCDKDKNIEIFKDDEQHILVEKVTNFIKENGKQMIELLSKSEKEQKITTINGFNGTLAEFLAQKSGSETEAQKLFLSVKNLLRVMSQQLDAEGKTEEGKEAKRDRKEQEQTEGKGCDKKKGDKGKGKSKEANANANAGKGKAIANDGEKSANANDGKGKAIANDGKGKAIANDGEKSANANDGEGKANANDGKGKANANDGDKAGVSRRTKRHNIKVRKVKDEVTTRSVRVSDKKQNKVKPEKEKTQTKKGDENGMEKGENEATNVQKIVKKTLSTNAVPMPSDLLQLLMQLWPQVLLLGAEGGPADAAAANDGKTSPRGHRRRKRSPQAEIEKTACVLLAILSLAVAFLVLYLFTITLGFFESHSIIFALTIAGICSYKLMKTNFYHGNVYKTLIWLNNRNRSRGYQFH
ncbi:hypothetical protein niasHT_019398 [Heterodera trifolii]|uniref:Uncharacterized protein n=1 Tax=Heterodera trifolii TaxID=157864 RepID=A0ABD2KVN0_9BILA